MIKFEIFNPLKTWFFGKGVKVNTGKVLNIASRQEFDLEAIHVLTDLVQKYGTEQPDGSIRYVLKDMMMFEKEDRTEAVSWIWIDTRHNLLRIGGRLAIDGFDDDDRQRIIDRIREDTQEITE